MNLTMDLSGLSAHYLKQLEKDYAIGRLARNWEKLSPEGPHYYFQQAVVSGNLKMMQWLLAKHSHVQLDGECLWDFVTCPNLARGGHLEVLKWALVIWGRMMPWDEDTCSNAAACGHLKVLKWLRANKCPWDPGTCQSMADQGGYPDVLQWARANKNI